MALRLLVIALGSGLFLGGVGSALGGLVLQGAGFGDAWGQEGFGGPYTCMDVPFEVTIVYLPANRAVLGFSWASVAAQGGNCFVVSNGGSLVPGTVSYNLMTVPPSVSHQATCIGNEASGISCGSFGEVGPYGGPGSTVWLRQAHTLQTFVGSFIAV